MFIRFMEGNCNLWGLAQLSFDRISDFSRNNSFEIHTKQNYLLVTEKLSHQDFSHSGGPATKYK